MNVHQYNEEFKQGQLPTELIKHFNDRNTAKCVVLRGTYIPRLATEVS